MTEYCSQLKESIIIKDIFDVLNCASPITQIRDIVAGLLALGFIFSVCLIE